MDPITTQQTMMTLSALAATSATERPSGETVDQQEQRIFAGINLQLEAIGGNWEAVWLGLSPDRANLAYIAQNVNTGSAQYAVCIRGTVTSSGVDLIEDMDVGSTVLFTPYTAGSTYISMGSMEAFTRVTNTPGMAGTVLIDALANLIADASVEPTVFVTGHSLGGATATVVAMYLKIALEPALPNLQVYTFAAPTAGLQDFTTAFDDAFGDDAFCYFNVWDVIPQAWSNLSCVESNFYPTPPTGPGPAASDKLDSLHWILVEIAKLPGKAVYVQPSQQAGLVNTGGNLWAPLYQKTEPPITNYPSTNSISQFEYQMRYQHANSTYLGLLGAEPLPLVPPEITSISPTCGQEGGGDVVTITGSGFTSDSVVDFGTTPASSSTVNSPSEMTATAPAGVGTVPVAVTNMLGTFTPTATQPAQFFSRPCPPT